MPDETRKLEQLIASQRRVQEAAAQAGRESQGLPPNPREDGTVEPNQTAELPPTTPRAEGS